MVAPDTRSKILDMPCQSGIKSSEWWQNVLVVEGNPLFKELEAI